MRKDSCDILIVVPCSHLKALYENMLVELPFAGFFLSKLLGTSADVDIHHLASLDPEVYKNLLFLKSYEGDVEELGLNFTVVNNDLGEAQVRRPLAGCCSRGDEEGFSLRGEAPRLPWKNCRGCGLEVGSWWGLETPGPSPHSLVTAVLGDSLPGPGVNP